MMTTPTIESVQERLRAARQQVADLEALLQQLKHEQETQRSKPSAAPAVIHKDYHDESESSSHLQGSTLQLVADWLDPLDLLRCLLVSKRWKEEMDQVTIWKQAGRRAIPKDIWNAMNLQQSNKDYYKKMLINMVEQPRRQVDIAAEIKANSKGEGDYWLPSTTLLPHQIFLMVTARWKDTGELFGSWCTNFKHWAPNESEFCFPMMDRSAPVVLPTPPLQGALDDHFREFYNPDPSSDVPTYVYDSISFSFRCIRTDTGESLHLGKNQDFEQYDTALWAYLDTDIGAPTARNDAGVRARELWTLKEFHRGGVCLRFNLRPIPPSDEEENDGSRAEPWHGTTYLLDGLECDFVAYRQDGSYEDFKNLRELLVSLDGYLWT